MFFSLSTFILGSALCGAAQNMNWLIAARGMCATFGFLSHGLRSYLLKLCRDWAAGAFYLLCRSSWLISFH